MAKIRVCGLDGSLRNFGIVTALYDTETGEIELVDLVLAKTAISKNKQVRTSSDNLARAQSISQRLEAHTESATVVFAEVPSGGQSYKAVLGFGIVIGLYASIKAPLIEVSPYETKLAAVGTKTAAKQEMIEWAFEKYPNAGWKMRKLHGEMVPTLDNEHLADAVAVIHAGVKTPSFLQTISILKQASI